MFKYKVGDLVRVSFLSRAFQRKYEERWSRKVFVMSERCMSDGLPQYGLKDYAGGRQWHVLRNSTEKKLTNNTASL